MTTAQLLNDWMTNYERERIKPRTYARYQGLIDQHIIPNLGTTDIGEISRRQVNEFLISKKHEGNTRYGGELSGASTNMMLTVLNSAFSYACDMELMKTNPCERIRRSSDKNAKQVDSFSREEQLKIEQTILAENDPRLLGVLLCLYTGLRIGELLGLEWADLDNACTILQVNKTVYREKNECGEWQLFIDSPKTPSSNRKIPLPPQITCILREQRENAKSIYVVETKQGKRMPIRSYQSMFERLTVKANVRKMNFHALRHTFATRALECGMDIKTLSEILGHKNASVTLNRYAHSMMDTKIAAMNRLSNIF